MHLSWTSNFYFLFCKLNILIFFFLPGAVSFQKYQRREAGCVFSPRDNFLFWKVMWFYTRIFAYHKLWKLQSITRFTKVPTFLIPAQYFTNKRTQNENHTKSKTKNPQESKGKTKQNKKLHKPFIILWRLHNGFSSTQNNYRTHTSHNQCTIETPPTHSHHPQS